MEGGESAKHFNPCGDGNDYSSGGKVGPSVYVYSYCKYMVGSDNKAKGPDAKYSINYSEGSKRFWLSRGVGNNVRDSSKSWEN